jgi:hypothetical protein
MHPVHLKILRYDPYSTFIRSGAEINPDPAVNASRDWRIPVPPHAVCFRPSTRWVPRRVTVGAMAAIDGYFIISTESFYSVFDQCGD